MQQYKYLVLNKHQQEKNVDKPYTAEKLGRYFLTVVLKFQGILKPAYNRVDMMEVEILDDDSDPRDFSDSIKKLRKDIVMQARGNVVLPVKSHLEDLVGI